MEIDPKPSPPDAEEVEEQLRSHNPSAPADELFDISTTVDPSYIISLIRTLLPPSIRNSFGANSGDVCNVGKKESGLDEMEECNNGISGNTFLDSRGKTSDAVDAARQVGDEGYNRQDVSVGEEAWEEYGCVLWDLAASKTHAEFMVQNLLLEVLLENLMVSQSARAMEICLGIIGNLSCHEVPRKVITTTNELVRVIVDQLFLDDTSCLCEAFRVLTLGLQGQECIIWGEELQSEHILSRVLWITENALNPQLIEKSVGLLLAILESQHIWPVLLPSLMKLGLPDLLINLVAFEIGNLTRERAAERYSVLELVLRSIEALSIIDGYSQELCSSKELFQLVRTLVVLPDKHEVSNSCVAAAVVMANILSDTTDIATEISNDLPFLQGLLNVLPFASDDVEAQNAIWSILARLLVRVQENDMTPSNLHQYVSVLASKTEIIEDNLLDHQSDCFDKENQSSSDSGFKLNARSIALRRITNILNQWIATKNDEEEEKLIKSLEKDETGDNDDGWIGENASNDGNVGRLLLCCQKYA